MSPETAAVRTEHERMRQLLMQARVEILPDAERSELEQHLQNCDTCGMEAMQMEDVMRQLRAVPVFASATLVRTTQSRVRARAREMRREQVRTAPMLVASGMVVLIALLSAPFVWEAFSWVADEFGLPPIVWQTGFLVFYLVPAGASVMLAVLHNRQSQDERARR